MMMVPSTSKKNGGELGVPAFVTGVSTQATSNARPTGPVRFQALRNVTRIGLPESRAEVRLEVASPEESDAHDGWQSIRRRRTSLSPASQE